MTDTSDDNHLVVREAHAVGEQVVASLAQIRSRARVALVGALVLVLILVAVLSYAVLSVSGAVGTIKSNQSANKQTFTQTLDGLRDEYAVACGLAAHYGVPCPPFPKAK